MSRSNWTMTRLLGPGWWLPLGLTLASTGCALDRGEGFSTLEAATLAVNLEPEEDAGEKQLLTDLGYQLVVERAAMRVARVALQEPAGSDNEAAEEPGDHEHGEADHEHGEADHEHGEADHEDEEHASSGAAFSELVTLGFDAEISMTSHEPVAADSCEPSRQLPRSSPERVLVVLEHFELEGTLGGGGFGDAAAELVIDLPLDIELYASLEPLQIDRDAPESVRLSTEVLVAETSFDGIDFAELAAGGSVVIDDPEAPAAVQLFASLAASDTHATLE